MWLLRVAFGGRRRPWFCGADCEPVLMEGLLDALRNVGSDALVDAECLP